MPTSFHPIAFVKRPAVQLLALALLYCALNAFKPIHMDDGAYFYFAKQIAGHPLDPYGFKIMWYDVPEAANGVLAPPVLPYTWAAAMDVVGDSPTLCKLVLLPWSLLLMWSLHALFRRFAGGWEMGLTALTAFSPFLLPSLNLMLDVPALALSLAAIHLFLRACDEDDLKRAACAGLLAGLAIETKYTGLVAPGVMLLAGVLFRRWRLIPVPLLIAAQMFVCWELLMAMIYGRSHFFNNLPHPPGTGPGSGWLALLQAHLGAKGDLLPCWFTLVGGVAPAVIVLGLAALGLRWRGLLAISFVLFLGFAAIAGDYVRYTESLRRQVQAMFAAIGVPRIFELSDAFCFLVGVSALLVVAAVAAKLLDWRNQEATAARFQAQPPVPEASRREGPVTETPRSLRPRQLTIFLLLWLGMETAGLLVLTPFPAVRRVLGVMVVMTLLIGQLAASTCRTPARRRTLHVILTGGIVLGFAFFVLDFWNGEVQRLAAEEAADWIQANGGGRVWFTGHWGFQYYAEHRNMQPVYVHHKEHLDPLQVDDWLVAPDKPYEQQSLFLDPAKLKEEHVVTEEDWIPLRTVPPFYGGNTALQHHEGPRLQVHIYRVVAAFDPVAKPSP